MINRKDFLKMSGGALASAYALGFAGCAGRGAGSGGDKGGDGKTFTVKFSHVNTPDTPKGQAADKFKEILEQKTDGQIKVEVYPNGSLYNDKEELQALQSNGIQMIATATSKLSSVDPRLGVLDLPFAVNSYDEIPQIISRDTKIGQLIYGNDELASKNIKGLDLWDIGFKLFHTNKPIQTPEDLKGLKIRIPPSPILQSQFKAWGAATTPMDLGEVYGALQQGVVDGGENAWTNVLTLKFYEVQKNITESNHGYIGNLLAVNNEFFESLPEDLRQALIEAAGEASNYNREVAKQTNEEAKKQIEEMNTTNISELSEQERQAFKDAVVPKVWDEYADLIGVDVVKELKSRQI